MAFIEFSDFSGGLNLQQNPLTIENNEAVKLDNFILDTSGLRRRDGFQIINSFTGNKLLALIQYNDTKMLLVDRLGKVIDYDIVNNTYSEVGIISTINVTPKLVYFEPYVCIATGASLVLYNTATQTLLNTSSPKAVDVMVKDGRVVIGGDDYVWFSRVGDPTDWTNDPNDDASAQFVEVGYKDGGEIIAIAPLFNDIIVFKTTGIFRVAGTLPGLSVSLVSRRRSVINNTSYVSILGDIIAYDKSGAYLLSASFRYGDLVMDSIDFKVKNYLQQNYAGYMSYLPRLNSIVFSLNGEFLLYNYQWKSWYKWKTALPINRFEETRSGIYAFDSILFKYEGDFDSYSPFIRDISWEIYYWNYPIYDFKEIEAVYESKQFVGVNAFVIKQAGIHIQAYRPLRDETVVFKVGKVTFSFPISATTPFIFDVKDEEVWNNFREVFGEDPKVILHKHQVQRVEDYSLLFKTTNPFYCRQFYIEVEGRYK